MRLSRKNKGIKRKLKRTKKKGGVSVDRKPQKVEKSSSNKPGKGTLKLDLEPVEKVRVEQNREYNDMLFLKKQQERNKAAIKINIDNETYTPPEKGVEKIDQSPNDMKDAMDRMDVEEDFYRADYDGVTFGGKTRKKKKEFLYNPNDPSKSFDVYINKNPSDTIPIKYTTVKDVRETISKLERLYKNKKYPHKRIWQVAMIMKVRLEAMKKHKKTRYPNAKNVTSRYNLANKYFKKLGKRSKELAKKRRTRKKKGGSDGETDDGETDDEDNIDKREFGNALDILDKRRGELKQRRSGFRRLRKERSLTDAEESELKSIEDELDKIDREFDKLHKDYDYYDENPNKRRRMRGGNNKKEDLLKLCEKGIEEIEKISDIDIKKIKKMVEDNSSTIDDIIMKSINNKKDVQENLWDLILELQTFFMKNNHSGGAMNLPRQVPTVRTKDGEDPSAAHEIDPHDIPILGMRRGRITQVFFWNDLDESEINVLRDIGADEAEIRELMAMGMTREQLYQSVRNIHNTLENTQGTGEPRYRFIILAIIVLLYSLPRVLITIERRSTDLVNLIADMMQMCMSLLYLVRRTGYL